ncbi:MAG: hypothetical protein EF806_02675 [Candidatus Methanoliparum thermophilum]|uniref:Probable tRNA sulfurtransferase n=1 Tax=Methanoliparum thermophilum TaxID=2491083 RepID=A0A520KTS8_METT2|nr:THUMP domain-containing protein [Candidatus Methanoliparum sp. LAM-1]RZN64965.1 MAG: hypothetical protein EF806_02675 [Candidatus Methanoliparum thermophilum]BDC36152.1 hypothetical protein MTLP_08340 [Candidatus Methanoliparum sp. LAM-1]
MGKPTLYLIRYDELALKSDYVRKKWEDQLVKSIKSRIKSCNIRRERGRIWVYSGEDISSKLGKIPGIHSFSLCYPCTLDDLKDNLLEFVERSLKDEKTFALRVKRIGDHNFTSQDVARQMGAIIQENYPFLSVDLENPEKEIFIEIRDRDCYLFDDIIKGVGGLPEGVEGSVLGCLSSELDLLACWMMIKRGCNIWAIIDKDFNKSDDLLKVLREFKPDIKSSTIEDLKTKKILGIVTGDIKIPSQKNEKRYKIPIYQPLIGLKKDYLDRFKKFFNINPMDKRYDLLDEKPFSRVVSLMSDGIDSPVATYLLLDKYVDVITIHFDNSPFIDQESLQKYKKIINHLNKSFKRNIKAYIIPNGKNLKFLAKNCKESLRCILCKRMMLRIAEDIADREKANGIVTGESIGQVASQTLHNLCILNQTVEKQIIRPLIGMNKIEIIEIAKKIGTYDISISPSLECKIVPKSPATSARLDDVMYEESKIDIKFLINESINNVYIC